MRLRQASLLLPCRRFEDFPTQLPGEQAAELLAAWTALWHPELIAATGKLPGWHAAEEPPAPADLDGELVLVPEASRQPLPAEWWQRVTKSDSCSKPLVVRAVPSREQTIAAALEAAGIVPRPSAECTSDFLALGFAHLQVELLTRAMRYSSVLDTERFAGATVAAANAAVAGNETIAREELTRAFDLLSDARNHVYSVDFYILEVKLLAESTLGDALRSELARQSPISILATGELLERMAQHHPRSLAELQHARESGTACVIGGFFHGGLHGWESPETLVHQLQAGRQAAQRYLGREYEVFGQFEAAFSPLLPQILKRMGFRGALHAAFDGGRLPKADQCKTWWGPREGDAIEALATMPLDISRPETWLQLAQRIGDSITRDYVSTVLLAGWPGTHCEYYDDLRRVAHFGTLLGKLITLEEYFRTTREPDQWTTFDPREYPLRLSSTCGPNVISQGVAVFRQQVVERSNEAAARLAEAAGLTPMAERNGIPLAPNQTAVINSWNFACVRSVGWDPLRFDVDGPTPPSEVQLLVVPGCGYATSNTNLPASSVALAEGRTLRNEHLELTVSETTGGIQSLRTHRDRHTRLSQRLVFQHAEQGNSPEVRMVADELEITRNDQFVGQITSRGQLIDSKNETLGCFVQTARLVRKLPVAIIDVELRPERLPEGDPWHSYYGSRIAWADDALSIRRGMQWLGRGVSRERIESPEWIEVSDGVGRVICFGLGLPFHRQVGPTWLDSLLIVAGEGCRRFQFALAIDEPNPTQAMLELLTAGNPVFARLPAPPDAPAAWFLHLGAKNCVITGLELFSAPAAGIRLRVLETEGLDTHTRLTAFRPLTAARITDFRGNPTEVLSVIDGRAELDIGPHRLIQIDAEW
jgi:alpha-mannosidase